MTRKDANKHDKMISSSDLALDERLEAEEVESRRALSLSIMHHAVQASSVKGSSRSLSQITSHSLTSNGSINMNMETNMTDSANINSQESLLSSNNNGNNLTGAGATASSSNHIEKYFDEEGWNIDEYYTTTASNKLSMNTRNRRSCMYICALLASVIVGVVVGCERLGFTRMQHFEDNISINNNKQNVEKVKYAGNYTDMNSVGNAGSGTGATTTLKNDQQKQNDYRVQDKQKTRSSSKFYAKNKYEVPDNIDETDDFVNMDQVLPTVIDTNLGNIFDENNDNKRMLVIDDIPYFWVIPRNGGNSIRYVLSYCFKSVLACEAGSSKEHGESEVLEVFDEDGCRYVNVNTETSTGIKRAKDLNLVNSGLAYAVFSSRLNEIASLFNTDRRARSFTLLRHPVERTISEFYQEQARNPKLSLVSLEKYLESNIDNANLETTISTALAVGEDNYIVRSLVNKPIAELTSYDLDLAMLILKKKFLIGLVDEMEESVQRFRKYYNWNTKGLKGVDECIMTFTSPSPRKKPIFSKNSKVWNILEQRNKWDAKLYDFALHLFDVQGLLLNKS